MRLALAFLIGLIETAIAALVAAAIVSQSQVAVSGMTLEDFQAHVTRQILITGLVATLLALVWAFVVRRREPVLRHGATYLGWVVSGSLALLAGFVFFVRLPRHGASVALLATFLVCPWIVYHSASAVAAPWSHAFVPPGGGRARMAVWRWMRARNSRA